MSDLYLYKDKEYLTNSYLRNFESAIDSIIIELSENVERDNFGITEKLESKIFTLCELYKKLADFIIKDENKLKFLNNLSYIEWEQYERK